METFVAKERSVNFGKEEMACFKLLLEKYKEVIFNKKSDSASNALKKKTWNAIHAEFNAFSDRPRTTRQLQAKFDNMKRNARKDASKERQARLATGGGPPAPTIEVDTKWLRNIMPISIDGLASIVDDDSEMPVNNHEVLDVVQGCNSKTYIEKNQNENINVEIVESEKLPVLNEMDKENNEKFIHIQNETPVTLLRTPISSILKVPRKKSRSVMDAFEKERVNILKKCLENEKALFDLKVLHMKKKREEEEIIFELQKQKLLLEISLLQNKK